MAHVFYKYYIPCLAIVIDSFLSFMVPILAIPGRVDLVVNQFLTLPISSLIKKVIELINSKRTEK